MVNIKCDGKWCNKSFTMMLELLQEILPEGNLPPHSCYESRKLLKSLGLTCKKIDACRNDCVLFRKQYSNLSICPICGTCKWKSNPLSTNFEVNRKAKPVLVKVLRYFPLQQGCKDCSYFRK